MKRISAFQNNAIVHKLKVLDNKDPLNQMMLLNDRKTFLLNKRLIKLKGITMEGSSWSVIGIWTNDLHMNKYDSLEGSSYIPLPAEIQNKKATVNLKNGDDECFIYCLGRALDPAPEKKNLEHVGTHLREVCESLGLNNIKTPVNVQDLSNIEKQFNISINLYSHSKSNIY